MGQANAIRVRVKGGRAGRNSPLLLRTDCS